MAVDLKEFDNDFEPAPPPNLLAKPEELTDGSYLFLVDGAQFVTTNKGHRIFKMALKVLTAGKHDGATVEYVQFMPDIDAAKRVGRTFLTLGFDSDHWLAKEERPFSTEFPKAVALLNRLKLRVKGRKATNKVEKRNKDGSKYEETYHNIYLDERERTDGQPEKFGAEALNQKDPDDPFS